jgi:hypothetical protein
MDEDWTLKLLNGEQLWKGKLSSSPSIKEFSLKLKSIPNDVENIAYLSAQITRSCPSKYIPVLLSALSCHFWRNDHGEIDVNKLLSLPSSGKKPVCGMVFKKGDLAWNCRTCGKDPTCVQCDPCFRKSDHKGHEVFFHRSSGNGGCCDW